MTLVLLPDVFNLAYEPGSDTLCASWPRPLPAAQLPACYEAMLAAAQARHNCRFWLLDIRQLDWYSAAFRRWFTDEFVPRAVAVLGQPLFIACIVADSQRAHIQSAATETLLRQVAKANCFPFYFAYEQAALDWLHDQRAAEQPHRASLAGRALAGER